MECSRRSPCVHEEREHRCLHEIRSSACAHATHLESDGLNSIQYYFSSRRRHTRSDRDWSSDVCSSDRSEEHTSELQSRSDLVCRLLLVTGVQTCALPIDRKSTRLNSSHDQISYAVFCLKKKKREDRRPDKKHTGSAAAPDIPGCRTDDPTPVEADSGRRTITTQSTTCLTVSSDAIDVRAG